MRCVVPQGPHAQHQLALSDQDFQMISELANRRYGLFLQPSKKALVQSRLARRVRALNLASFQDYCRLLTRTEGNDECAHLLSALTTNVTNFFREKHHFDFLGENIAPRLLASARAGQAVRLWTSACSYGQEAYSMAAAILSVAPELAKRDFKILATDIDPHVLQTARKGVYSTDQINVISNPWRDILTDGSDLQAPEITMSAVLKGVISFGELNLVAEWPMRRKFDVIFCRNVAIYFHKSTQARLWQRFANVLVDDGYLMIGHSERLSGPAVSAFKSAGITTYRKHAAPAQPGFSQPGGDGK